MKLIKDSLICMASHGTAESTPCKIAEYLAMSRCIVAEKITDRLPVPLEDRRNIYFFDNIEQAICICKYLLEHPDEAQRVRKAAHEYFLKYASPREALRRCLKIALGREHEQGVKL